MVGLQYKKNNEKLLELSTVLSVTLENPLADQVTEGFTVKAKLELLCPLNHLTSGTSALSSLVEHGDGQSEY